MKNTSDLNIWISSPELDPRDIKIAIPFDDIIENNDYFRDGLKDKNDFKTIVAKSDLRKWLVNTH